MIIQHTPLEIRKKIMMRKECLLFQIKIKIKNNIVEGIIKEINKPEIELIKDKHLMLVVDIKIIEMVQIIIKLELYRIKINICSGIIDKIHINLLINHLITKELIFYQVINDYRQIIRNIHIDQQG